MIHRILALAQTPPFRDHPSITPLRCALAILAILGCAYASCLVLPLSFPAALAGATALSLLGLGFVIYRQSMPQKVRNRLANLAGLRPEAVPRFLGRVPPYKILDLLVAMEEKDLAEQLFTWISSQEEKRNGHTIKDMVIRSGTVATKQLFRLNGQSDRQPIHDPLLPWVEPIRDSQQNFLAMGISFFHQFGKSILNQTLVNPQTEQQNADFSNMLHNFAKKYPNLWIPFCSDIVSDPNRPIPGLLSLIFDLSSHFLHCILILSLQKNNFTALSQYTKDRADRQQTLYQACEPLWHPQHPLHRDFQQALESADFLNLFPDHPFTQAFTNPQHLKILDLSMGKTYVYNLQYLKRALETIGTQKVLNSMSSFFIPDDLPPKCANLLLQAFAEGFERENS